MTGDQPMGPPTIWPVTLDFLEALTGSRLDGDPFLRLDVTRRYVAVKLGERLDHGLGPAIRRMRLLRGFLRRIGDNDGAETLTMCMRPPATCSRPSTEASVRAAFDDIAAWEAANFPSPFAL